MKNWEKPWLPPFVLGGHVFHTKEECCREFNIPPEYVVHMLESLNYPGCYYLAGADLTSYMQTLSINVR